MAASDESARKISYWYLYENKDKKMLKFIGLQKNFFKVSNICAHVE